MTLDEAIQHCEEKALRNRLWNGTQTTFRMVERIESPS